MKNLLLNLNKYSPKCETHETMKQVRRVDGYYWVCLNKSCKKTKTGINQKAFLTILEDLDFNISIERETIKKNLLYFSHLLKTDLSILLEAIRIEIDYFTDNWKNNFKSLEKKSENLLKEKLEEEKKDLEKKKEQELKYIKNKRVCLLCGLSMCQQINNCMVTSD